MARLGQAAKIEARGSVAMARISNMRTNTLQ